MAGLGASTRMANVTANICNVNGTGPMGTVIQADTVMMAMENAVNATERLRESVAARGLMRVLAFSISYPVP